MKERASQWFQLYLIVILAFVAFIIAFPRIPIQLNIAGKEYHQELAGPDIDFTLFGKDFYKELNFGYGLYLGGGSKWTFDVDLELIPEEEKSTVFRSVQKQFEERMVMFGLDNVELSTDDENFQISLSFVEDQVEIQDLILVYREGSVEFSELKEEYRESEDEAVLSDPLSYEETELDDAELLGASILMSPTTGEPLIQLHLSDSGQQMFYDVSKRNEGLPVAILLDEQIIAAPRISSDLTEDSMGDPVLSGGYTEETAELLEKVFDAGPLSAPVNFSGLEEVDSTISPSTLKSFAMISTVGIAVLLMFLVIYLGGLGSLIIPEIILFVLLFVAVFKLGVPSVLVWVLGGKMPETLFTTLLVSVGGVIGFALSLVFVFISSVSITAMIKSENKKHAFDVESIESSFKKFLTITKRIVGLIFVLSLVIGIFGSGLFRDVSMSLVLGTVIGFFTIHVVLKNLVLLFGNRLYQK